MPPTKAEVDSRAAQLIGFPRKSKCCLAEQVQNDTKQPQHKTEQKQKQKPIRSYNNKTNTNCPLAGKTST